MKAQPMRAAYLIQMSLLERRADLLPQIASQSYFESMRSFLTTAILSIIWLFPEAYCAGPLGFFPGFMLQR